MTRRTLPHLLAKLTVAALVVAASDLVVPVRAMADVSSTQVPVVGNAATVVNLVTGTLGPVEREIVIDDDVFTQEVIETGAGAAARLVFRDGTELVLAAGSRVTLDRFVYDPQTGDGQLVMNMLSGAFEFASGLMPPASYHITTPFGTLAIRG